MQGFVTTGLIHRTKCPARNCTWEWRELGACATVGAFLVQRHCPRCKRDYLLVFRIERFPETDIPLRVRYLGGIEHTSRTAEGIRFKLSLIAGLTMDEVELLVFFCEQQPVPA